MPSPSRFVIVLSALLTLGTAPAVAGSVADVNARVDALFGGHDSLLDAFEALQLAVKTDHAETVAALVRYPFRIHGGERVLRNEADFAAHYEKIFTPDVKEAVERQTYGDLLVDEEGVSFKGEALRLIPVCIGRRCSIIYWLISTINS